MPLGGAGGSAVSFGTPAGRAARLTLASRPASTRSSDLHRDDQPAAVPRRHPARGLCLAALALGVVLGLRLWLELVGPLPGDRWSLRFTPWPPRPEPWQDVIALFALLGTPLLAAVSVGVAAWVVGRGMGARAAAFVVVASAGVVPNAGLKALLGPTPLWSSTHAGSADNYPSGHVVYAVAFWGALAVLARERGRRDLVAIAAAAVVVMGPTRVFGGAHLPSDVLAGYLLGAAWLIAATVVLRPGRGDRRAAMVDRDVAP